MTTWSWIGLGWLVCAVIVVVGERILAHTQGSPLFDRKDLKSSIPAYIGVILISPFVIIFALCVLMGRFYRELRERLSPSNDPFLEEESFNQIPECFIADVMRRRKRADKRLRRVNPGNLMMWQLLETPDGMILDVVTKYASLKSFGIADELIWEKLEANRHEKGEGALPRPCSLLDYVTYRLSLEDPPYVALGSQFIAGQIALCDRYQQRRGKGRDGRSWPPAEWLKRQMNLAEFEALGTGFDPFSSGAPAALTLGGGRVARELEDLKVLMLPGDELWSFASPPQTWQQLAGRAGIALIRNGMAVGHVVTKMN